MYADFAPPYVLYNNIIPITANLFHRYPSLLPVLEPEFVAKKVIEGLRRNQNKIYIPGSVGIFSKFLM